MDFDTKIEEAYRGFGQSSHLDVSELRLLYYGRPDIYLTFTDDGDVETEHEDLPDCFIAYDVRDVVGKKIQSSDFYAYVYRMKGEVTDVKRYSPDDFKKDIEFLSDMEFIDPAKLDYLIKTVGMDSRNRYYFQRIWNLTRAIAIEINGRGYRHVWKELLVFLGFDAISDPSSSGLLGEKEPRTLYLAYGSREDLDILPIQRYREDPRKRVERQIERYRRKMRGSSNRVAKRRDNSKRIF